MIVFISLEIIFLGYLENKLFYKTGCTPLMALYFPTLLILLLAKFFDTSLDIKQYLELLFILANSWFFIGIFLKLILLMIVPAKNRIENKLINLQNINKYIVISLVLAIIQAYQKFGLSHIKGNLGGFFAHIYIILSPFSISLFCFKKKYSNYIYLISILGLLSLGGKYQFFLFILPFFLKKLYEQKNVFKLKNIKFVFILFLAVYSIFSVVYYINFKLSGISTNKFYDFIKEHLGLYAFSPIYIGNYLLTKSGMGQNYSLAPFENIYRFLVGNNSYINPILQFFEIGKYHSNVGGLIPELVYSSNYKIMYIYMYILGIIAYFLENLILINKNWIYTNLIFKSALILCFFSNVFSVLGYIERIIGCLILTFIFIFFNKIKKNYFKNMYF